MKTRFLAILLVLSGLSIIVDDAYGCPYCPKPPAPSLLSPLDGACMPTSGGDLSWNAWGYSCCVYLSTHSNPDDLLSNPPHTGPLELGKTYYWRVRSWNACGSSYSTTWRFTTLPGKATNPAPTNGATNVSINADLSWAANAGATSHDVYFGTTSPGTFQGNQPETTFDTGTMNTNTTYYWRIDEKNACDTNTGDVWSFITVQAGEIIDINSDITTNQLWTANNIYYVTDYVNVKALLVIEPGTMVIFGYECGLFVNNGGTLISKGTPDKPIIYTCDFLYFEYPEYIGYYWQYL